MAYVADDFAYIAKRLKEIRASAKRLDDAWMRDPEELPPAAQRNVRRRHAAHAGDKQGWGPQALNGKVY
jgi:hypothetical protein